MEGEGDLRDQSHRVDRVGGQERLRPAERLIGQGPLHQRLTVVKGAVDGERHHVGPTAGDLGLLHRTHPDTGIEDHRAHAGDAVARLGHGAPGVAGGGGENGEAGMLRGEHPGGHTHQQTDREVLEGGGRPVEELQDGNPARRGRRQPPRSDQRHRKVEGLLAEGLQDVRPELLGKERTDDRFSQRGVIGIRMRLEKVGGEAGYADGHPESAARRNGGQQHLAQAGTQARVGGGDELQLRTRRRHGRPWD